MVTLDQILAQAGRKWEDSTDNHKLYLTEETVQ